MRKTTTPKQPQEAMSIDSDLLDTFDLLAEVERKEQREQEKMAQMKTSAQYLPKPCSSIESSKSASQPIKLTDFDFLSFEEAIVAGETVQTKPHKTEKYRLSNLKRLVPVCSKSDKTTPTLKSLVHEGSDSEDENKAFNSYGQVIDNVLKTTEIEKKNKLDGLLHSSWKSRMPVSSSCIKSVEHKPFGTASSCIKPVENKAFGSNVTSYMQLIGINVIKPVMDLALFVQKLSARTFINFNRIKNHVDMLSRKDPTVFGCDWCMCGVLVSKTTPKQSQKGHCYSVLRLSDLKGEMKIISIVLFGSACTHVWKKPLGTVVGILNPKSKEQSSDSGSEVSLTVFNHEQIMILGESADLGFCKARKKNGDPCSMYVNKSVCSFCQYHVASEYKKTSNSRSELQSSCGGGGRESLRNKILGKNEVFYGGQSFVATKKGVTSKKSLQKDTNTLTKLYGNQEFQAKFEIVKTTPEFQKPPSTEFSRLGKIKDAQRLALLSEKDAAKAKGDGSIKSFKAKMSLEKKKTTNGTTAPSPKDLIQVELPTSTTLPTNMSSLEKWKRSLKNYEPRPNGSGNLNDVRQPAKSSKTTNEHPTCNRLFSDYVSTPLNIETLSNNRSNNSGSRLRRSTPSCTITSNSLIDVSKPVSNKDRDRAKKVALNYVRNLGPIVKTDPNEVRDKSKVGKKRPYPEDEEPVDGAKSDHEKSKAFVAMMNLVSKHEDLVNSAYESAMDKYFETAGKKDEMEEKMLNTFKVTCKAVTCIICKYTWFAASDYCKQQNHPIKVVEGTKRFFSCNSCSYRTVSLDRYPSRTCRNCGQSSWERAPMISVKSSQANLNQLSIRGGEQTFVNSHETNGNLNLLVPD